MLFNSIGFVIFFLIVFSIYWCLPHRFRWILLLISSYYFYMSWNAKYVVLILFTTVISYGAAIILENTKKKSTKKLIVLGTVVSSIGLLFFFKYFNFVSESIASLLSMFAIKIDPVTVKLLLPVGISFYTFQTLSYVIDVYKGDVPAEHHFGYYAVFISFFPQLVAGPIERTGNLLPQIKGKHNYDYNQVTYGLKLMAWGYFKKIVIADTLAIYVSRVYDSPHNYQGFSLVLASLFFAIQIYCDFSGYSEIAIGTAKMLGINLMTNFKSPYFSQSVKEFWSRWHISLSTWFRDYIYIPLGGNRVGKMRQSINLMITFLVSGLWHGANWTYVVWGGIHGAAQIIENIVITKNKLKSFGIFRWIRVLFVFLFSVFAWIFFVSKSLGDALYVITNMFVGITSPLVYLKQGFGTLITTTKEGIILLFLFIPIILMGVYDYVSLKGDVIEIISSKKIQVRWTVYYVFTLFLLLWISTNIEYTQPEFIYFQF